VPSLAALLIVTIAVAAPAPGGRSDAVELYHCDFERDQDQDFDDWPDGWTRAHGEGYPRYVRALIEAEPGAPRHALRIDLNGGAAKAMSPPVAIDPRHDYRLEAQMKTVGLTHNRAFVSLVFLDDQKRPVERFDSESLAATHDWTRVRIGPVRCRNLTARSALLVVQVEPGEREDLHGAALFDSLRLCRVPRVTVELVQPRPAYVVGEPIDIHCRVSGYKGLPPVMRLVLRDAEDRLIAEHELTLQRAAAATAKGAKPEEDSAKAFQLAESKWRLPINSAGYYRLRATAIETPTVEAPADDDLSNNQSQPPSAGAREQAASRATSSEAPASQPRPDEDGLFDVEEVVVAVIEPRPRLLTGEFGWSLPDGEREMPPAILAQWVTLAGIHWLKYPLWFDEGDEGRVAGVNWLVDRLNTHGVGLIGLLADPPPLTRQALGIRRGGKAADLFAQDPRIWYPSLEPVMARMSLKVRWWQLGTDDDTSFAGLGDPVATVARVKEQLDRIGQDVRTGLAWNWLDEVPRTKSPPWSFLTRSASPALSAEELADYLAANSALAGEQWISLTPLDPVAYDTRSRAADLVRRLVAAKAQGATKIFLNAPLDPILGLLRADGSPGELFLPWRTTALMLAGARYQGQMLLPGGSRCRVFLRGEETILVVASAAPTDETVYLGDQVRQVDVWGRTSEVPQSADGQRFEAGPMPVFLTGANSAVIGWRLGLAIDRRELPSISGTPHQVRVTCTNHFSQPVSGKMRIVVPKGWRVEPEAFDLKLQPDESLRPAFSLTFPTTASCGEQLLRFDFDLQAERRYQFQVQRPIELGSHDVFLEIGSHLNAAGELEVEQRLVNRTAGDVNFRCHLNIPGRRRMRSQVWKLPPGEDLQVYRVPAGDDLVGQTLRIRAEESGGSRRILNYSFVAEP
jgi:hypothetical protein